MEGCHRWIAAGTDYELCSFRDRIDVYRQPVDRSRPRFLVRIASGDRGSFVRANGPGTAIFRIYLEAGDTGGGDSGSSGTFEGSSPQEQVIVCPRGVAGALTYRLRQLLVETA